MAEFSWLIYWIDYGLRFNGKTQTQKPGDNRISYLMLGAFVLQASELGDRIMNETLRYRLVEKFGDNYAAKDLHFLMN